MPEIVVFLAGSGYFIYVSRASLAARNSHGFYRFFAWEGLLALFLLNWRGWFREPFSGIHLLSWALLTVSLGLVIPALVLLRRAGKPGVERQQADLLGLEKTSRLVTSGVYRSIRHPMYSSLLFLGWGIFFKAPSWVGGLLSAGVTVLLYLTARREEGEDVAFFGEAYRDYMLRTKMFIPGVF